MKKFKKIKKINKKNIIKRSRDEDDESESEEISLKELTKNENTFGTKTGTSIRNIASVSSSNELELIQAVKKRRKLKSFQKVNRGGTDSVSLLVSHSNQAIERENDEGNGDNERDALVREANKDLRKRLEGNFLSNKGAFGNQNDNDGDEEGGILGRKHKIAMEEFIRERMKEKSSEENFNRSANGENDHEMGDKKNVTENSNLDDKFKKNDSKQESNSLDEDVGAGGAMLGGTGIAEVMLPVEDRIRAAREAELALMNKVSRNTRFVANENKFNNNAKNRSEVESNLNKLNDPIHSLPKGFGVGPGKKRGRELNKNNSHETSNGPTYKLDSIKDMNSSGSIPCNYSASSAGTEVLSRDVSYLGASYAHNFKMHQHEWVSNLRSRQDAESSQTKHNQEQAQGSDANRQRIGFEMKRKGLADDEEIKYRNGKMGSRQQSDQKQSEKSHPKEQRPSDDRVWKNFVTREWNSGRGR